MALWKFSNLNKHGNLRTRIIFTPTSQLSFNPHGLGNSIFAQRFKYTYNHDFTPPALITTFEGKRYIVPSWKEVLPQTTLNDINWVKPEPKKVEKVENIIKINKSSSSNKTYTTKYFPNTGKYHCDCPGTWRTGGNCKHVKELRIEIETKNK